MKGPTIVSMAGILTAAALLLGAVVMAPALSTGQRPPAASFDEKNSAALRTAMVEEQIVARGVSDRSVIEAMLAVPRHLFVPEISIGRAYSDMPQPIGHGQTISQPYIVAAMTEASRSDKDDIVLEVGTGSGYQAAVLSRLVRKVYSIEIIPELAQAAAIRLRRLGYANVEVVTGDGYYGLPDHAPFDAIVVTAAAGHIPPPLLRQLKNGGRMVIPVGGPFLVQNLVIVKKDETGRITTRNLMPVLFVPLTGKHDSQ